MLASAYLLRLLPWLYHIDPTFAACNLVPLLTNPSSNYRSYWKARLYGEVAGNPTLFNLLKGQILNQFRDPPVAAPNAGNMILAIFLPMLWKYQNPDGVWDITPQEIRSALTAAPAEIRHVGAWQIFSWMIEKEPGQEPSAERWTKLFGRLFKGCWPHDVSCRDGAISERLVRAATAAGSAFQDAVSAVLPVLVPFDIWSIRTISAEPGMGAQLAHQFPGGMLALLNAIVAPEKAKVPNDLADLLSVCLSADRKLEREPNYQRLHSIARRDAA